MGPAGKLAPIDADPAGRAAAGSDRGAARRPGGARSDLDADLTQLLDVTERYEAACERARAVLAERSDPCGAAARALCYLALKVWESKPKTIAGLMVHAQALAAYSEPEGRAGGVAGPGQAGVILGRGLADAVLRVAGVGIGSLRRGGGGSGRRFSHEGGSP